MRPEFLLHGVTVVPTEQSWKYDTVYQSQRKNHLDKLNDSLCFSIQMVAWGDAEKLMYKNKCLPKGITECTK